MLVRFAFVHGKLFKEGTARWIFAKSGFQLHFDTILTFQTNIDIIVKKDRSINRADALTPISRVENYPFRVFLTLIAVLGIGMLLFYRDKY